MKDTLPWVITDLNKELLPQKKIRNTPKVNELETAKLNKQQKCKLYFHNIIFWNSK